MSQIMAVCDNCKEFFPSGFGFDAGDTSIVANLAIPEMPVGPCPKCGGSGRALAGVYKMAEDTAELLQGPERITSELERLADILRDARQRNVTAEELRQTIEQETPKLSKLSSLLPRTRTELYAFLMVVLTIIQMILTTAHSRGVNVQDVDIDIDQIFGVTVEQHVEQVPKVGRNERCPCGSGKKYKKCHGNPVREQRTSPTR